MIRLIFIGLLLVLFTAFSMPEKYKMYCERHKLKANLLEHSTGVPTSVQLAQAIIESGGGRSNIAKRAKNHFGIKCGDNWTGQTYEVFKKDSSGQAILLACWRSYSNVGDSYLDHACFLSDYYGNAAGQNWRFWVRNCQGYGGPGYWREVGRVINLYKLYKYDLYK